MASLRNALFCLAAIYAAIGAPPTRAAQIIPIGVEYSNDHIEQGGKLQACIVTVGIINPPASEIVNFQILAVFDRMNFKIIWDFKITAGDLDWKTHSMVAKRVSGGTFSTSAFNHPSAFVGSITPEGQFLGTLTNPSLEVDFAKSFFLGRYLIRFLRDDTKEERVYYIENTAAPDIRSAFISCLHHMAEQLK
jgi:hypothetical protein